MTWQLNEGGMREKMAPKATPKPLRDGTGWYVEIIWSDGETEHVGDFGLESTAWDWIERDLPGYLRGQNTHE